MAAFKSRSVKIPQQGQEYTRSDKRYVYFKTLHPEHGLLVWRKDT